MTRGVEIWLNVANFVKFEKTEEYKRVQEINKQIDQLEEEINNIILSACKKYNIEYEIGKE